MQGSAIDRAALDMALHHLTQRKVAWGAELRQLQLGIQSKWSERCWT
jgi:hypothetical protein